MLPLVRVHALFKELCEGDPVPGGDHLRLPVVFGLDPGGKLRRAAGGTEGASVNPRRRGLRLLEVSPRLAGVGGCSQPVFMRETSTINRSCL